MPITIDGLPYAVIKYIEESKDAQLEYLHNKIHSEAEKRHFEK